MTEDSLDDSCLKYIVRAPVGVFADASQSRHWPFPWSVQSQETAGDRFDWNVYHEENREDLLGDLGDHGNQRKLACVVIASSALQLQESREWLRQEHVASAFQRAINSGMGLVILPSRIPEDTSPLPLSFLPHECSADFVHQRSMEIPMDQIRIPDHRKVGLFDISDLATANTSGTGRTTVLNSFHTDSPHAWESLLLREPDGQLGDVFLSRSTRGRIAVSTLQLDLKWPDLLFALVQRAVRPSGLLVVSDASQVAKPSDRGVRRWMRVVPGTLHAAATTCATEFEQATSEVPGADAFSHLVFFGHPLPTAEARKELAHRVENGGSATYVVGDRESEMVLSIRGEPEYLAYADEAERRILERQSDIDSTMFNLVAFALTAAKARKCISDRNLVPRLFSSERVASIVSNAYFIRTAGSGNGSIDHLVIPTVNALLAIATLGPIDEALRDRGLTASSDVQKSHRWVIQLLRDPKLDPHDRAEVYRIMHKFISVCGIDSLSDELRQWWNSQASMNVIVDPTDDLVFATWQSFLRAHTDGQLAQIDELSAHIDELETVTCIPNGNFESLVYAYLLLMEAASALPLGSHGAASTSNPKSDRQGGPQDSDTELVKQQNARITQLRNERDYLESEYSFSLTSSRAAWGALAIVLTVILIGGLLALTLLSDWDIKHDAGLYFGFIAALIVVCSILVRKMQWYRRWQMVPGWMWRIIRILGFFREPGSDAKEPSSAMRSSA